jgi:hypothetical protein
MDYISNEIAFYNRIKVKITCKLKIVKKIITVKIKDIGHENYLDK